MQFQFHYLWLLCLYFLFLPRSVLEGCTFLRISPFFLCCLFYWCIVACSSLLWSFVFLWSQCNISFFIFNFIGLNPPPFFKIDESSLRFISFVYLPKELLVLLIFAIVFLFLFHLLYALVFMISFLLLILGSFIFLFLFPLDIRWVSLLGIFLIYWGKILFL